MFRVNETILSLAIGVMLVTGGLAQEVVERVLPEPHHVEMNEDVQVRPGDFSHILIYRNATSRDQNAARMLRDKLNAISGDAPTVETIRNYDQVPDGAVVLGVPARDSKFKSYASDLPDTGFDSDESYVLDIGNSEIIVSGKGNAGLYYGVQTLLQLFEESHWEQRAIPGMVIRDGPVLDQRLVHFDVKHHLDRFEYMKNAIEKLGRYKINGIVLELFDKFQYESHPVLAAPNSLSPEQVKKLYQHARKHHLTIIPLVQGLGHAGYILKHEKYRHLRVDPDSEWAFDPLKDETYDLQFDLYRETIEATPGGRFYHVGGDEVGFHGSEGQDVQQLDMYLTWLNRVHDYLSERDRTVMFWDDVPLKEAGLWGPIRGRVKGAFDEVWEKGTEKLQEQIKKFPRDAIFMRWSYGMARTKANKKILDWYKKNGFRTIACTAAQTTRPLMSDYSKKTANIKSFVTLAAEKDIMGQFCTAWDDSGVHFATYWVGFLASGEYAWSNESPSDLKDYWKKFIRRFYGPGTSGLVDAFHNLSRRVDFWMNGLTSRGPKHLVHRRRAKTLDLPDPEHPPSEQETWTAVYAKRARKARAELKKLEKIINVLERNMNSPIRNWYNLKVYHSMAEFMKSHANLVASLGRVAQLSDEVRTAGEGKNVEKRNEKLKHMAQIAKSSWKQYKATYEKMVNVWELSRYPRGGKGFVPYRYHHFASRREDMSYLIMPEQRMGLPEYPERIRQFIEK